MTETWTVQVSTSLPITDTSQGGTMTLPPEPAEQSDRCATFPWCFRERQRQSVTLLALQGWAIRLEVETLGGYGWPRLYYVDGFVGLVGWGRVIEVGILRTTPTTGGD